MTRVALWQRVSTDEQTTENQGPVLREYAASRGWRIVREYLMTGVSAYKEETNAAAVAKALSECDAFDILLAVRLDRFTRRGIETALRYVREFKERGVKVVTVDDGAQDGPTGELITAMRAWFANQESAIKSERIKASVIRRHGQYLGGSRPYGYERDGVTIREEEAAMIREAAKRVLAGEPVRAIARNYNARDVPTAKGGPWSRSTLYYILRGGRISGQYMLGHEIGGDAEWPGIITKADTLVLRRILEPKSETVINEDGSVRKRKSWSAVPPRTLLSGVIRCAAGHRGATAMVGWTRRSSHPSQRAQAIQEPRKKYRAYRCLECCAVISGTGTDDWVADHIITRLDRNARAGQAQPATEDARLLFELNRLHKRRAEFIADACKGILTRKDRNDLLVGINQDIEAAEAAVTVSRHRTARDMWASGDLAGRWDSLTLDQRRAVVASGVERVEIRPLPDDHPGPRTRFHPERITIVWRD